jgi:hypothetical protein
MTYFSFSFLCFVLPSKMSIFTPQKAPPSAAGCFKCKACEPFAISLSRDMLNRSSDDSCPSQDFHKRANDISAKVPNYRNYRLAIPEGSTLDSCQGKLFSCQHFSFSGCCDRAGKRFMRVGRGQYHKERRPNAVKMLENWLND